MGGDASGLTAAEAAAALDWWLEAGVDVAVREEPRNWLQSPAAPSEAPAPAVAGPEPLQLPETLDLFRAWLGTATSAPRASAASRRVLPHGAEGAPVMLLADAPTGEDAAADRPIAGEAWELTQRMLSAIGVRCEDAYCANISCFHAPGARMSEEELESCAAIARRHVLLARPKRLLLLGDAPARALLGKPIAAARGHVHMIEGVRTVATFHPRFLLKHSSSKSLAWKDLLLLMEETP